MPDQKLLAVEFSSFAFFKQSNHRREHHYSCQQRFQTLQSASINGDFPWRDRIALRSVFDALAARRAMLLCSARQRFAQAHDLNLVRICRLGHVVIERAKLLFRHQRASLRVLDLAICTQDIPSASAVPLAARMSYRIFDSARIGTKHRT